MAFWEPVKLEVISGKKQKRGLYYTFISIIGSTTVFLLGKIGQENISTELFCLYWYGCAAIILTFYNFLYFRINPFSLFKQYKLSLSIYLIIEGLTSYVFFNSLKKIDPSVASFITLSNTLFLVFMGVIILGEQFNKLNGVGAFLIICGIVIVSIKSGLTINLEAIILLFSCFLWALNLTIASTFIRKQNPFSIVYLRVIFMALIFIIISLINRGSILIPNNEWIFAVLGGFFGPCVNMVFYYFGIQYLEISYVSLLRSLAPILVFIFSIILLKMIPTSREIIGCLIILIGNFIILFSKYKIIP